MKSIKNICLLFVALIFACAFAACNSESTIPSSYHSQPVHGESHWNE